MFKSLIITLIAVFSPMAFSAASEAQQQAQQKAYVMCKNHDVVRTIRVTNDSGGCVTTYTKLGVDQVVGKGLNQDSCVSVLKNIKENLEKASWNCKDISQARVSSSEQ